MGENVEWREVGGVDRPIADGRTRGEGNRAAEEETGAEGAAPCEGGVRL